MDELDKKTMTTIRIEPRLKMIATAISKRHGHSRIKLGAIAEGITFSILYTAQQLNEIDLKNLPKKYLKYTLKK